ncbi:MAG: hypothetical protein JWM16_1319 [Verrucomicrobiales bacterium]|nr:hypothetical protein [Verrucomicrobiales bacterium]
MSEINKQRDMHHVQSMLHRYLPMGVGKHWSQRPKRPAFVIGFEARQPGC